MFIQLMIVVREVGFYCLLIPWGGIGLFYKLVIAPELWLLLLFMAFFCLFNIFRRVRYMQKNNSYMEGQNSGLQLQMLIHKFYFAFMHWKLWLICISIYHRQAGKQIRNVIQSAYKIERRAGGMQNIFSISRKS